MDALLRQNDAEVGAGIDIGHTVKSEARLVRSSVNDVER